MIEQEAATPRRSKGRWIVVTSAVVAVLIAAAAVLFGLGVFNEHKAVTTGPSATPSSPVFGISGYVTLHGVAYQDYLPDGQGGCQGAGGFSDMTAGTAVTVADGTGHIVATGSLQAGVMQDDIQCAIAIDVENVPTNLGQYVVTVSHRGSQVLTYQQAQQPLELTLGN
jgi:hypothetical protein